MHGATFYGKSKSLLQGNWPSRTLLGNERFKQSCYVKPTTDEKEHRLKMKYERILSNLFLKVRGKFIEPVSVLLL